MTRPTLSAPIVVSEFWKNRGGESIRVTLATYQSRNIVDVRVFHSEQGRRKPTQRGIAADIKHLVPLKAALLKAEATARELGLIATDDDGGDQ